MNIIVVTYSGAIVVRPDTTWERDNEDLYLPDFVSKVSAATVACAKVCKPGRSVNKKFLNRYIDNFGFGVLLYPDNLIDGSPEGFAQACCLDHTSFIQMPMSSAEAFFKESNVVNYGDRQVCNITIEKFEQALEALTKRIYIRTGDIIAIEIEPMTEILSREQGNKRISAEDETGTVIDFNIIVE